jgi:hypothetical protein
MREQAAQALQRRRKHRQRRASEDHGVVSCGALGKIDLA